MSTSPSSRTIEPTHVGDVGLDRESRARVGSRPLLRAGSLGPREIHYEIHGIRRCISHSSILLSEESSQKRSVALSVSNRLTIKRVNSDS